MNNLNNNLANYNTWGYNGIQWGGTNYSTSSILIALAIILFILVGCAYYYFYVIPIKNATFRANNELIYDDYDNNIEIIIFFADWCPFSKQAMPIWIEFKKQYENKPYKGYNIIFTEIDSSEENATVTDMMDKYKVEGFPTIKMIKGGKVIEFDAKPSKDTLDQFLTAVLN